MDTFYSGIHLEHRGRSELNEGRLIPCAESPERAFRVLERVRETNLGAVLEPGIFGASPLLRLHRPQFLSFLREAWSLWSKEHGDVDAMPLCSPIRGLRGDIEPHFIDGRVSYYAFDAGTPIMAGTWRAASAAADVALSAAAHLLSGHRAVFALCRPPGHHATADSYGGYCYLNNAALAAQWLIDAGTGKVAILDVDYHHGNGTQSLFYDRCDVVTISLHADPRYEFPYFLGHRDEVGAGAGEEYNVNFPLPLDTGFVRWSEALEAACDRITGVAPDVLVVSLGVDTYRDDPLGRFRLDSDDYGLVGQRIARLGLPTLFVMEGGYALDAIGVNTVNVLQGFESQA